MLWRNFPFCRKSSLRKWIVLGSMIAETSSCTERGDFRSICRYLYKQFIFLTNYYNIPTISCWTTSPSDEIVQYHHNEYDYHPNVVCEGPGIPMFFYLEVVWYLGGLSIFTLYMFSTFLRSDCLIQTQNIHNSREFSLPQSSHTGWHLCSDLPEHPQWCKPTAHQSRITW